MISAPKIRIRPVQDSTDDLPAQLHPVIRRILLARGVCDADGMDHGLARLCPPHALLGIDQASSMLADAIIEEQKILIVGDFDADGATGTALAVKALTALGARRVGFKVPNRFEFGYGLSEALVETLSSKPPDVLVTVDSGISCLAGVRKAKALGLAPEEARTEPFLQRFNLATDRAGGDVELFCCLNETHASTGTFEGA